MKTPLLLLLGVTCAASTWAEVNTGVITHFPTPQPEHLKAEYHLIMGVELEKVGPPDLRIVGVSWGDLLVKESKKKAERISRSKIGNLTHHRDLRVVSHFIEVEDLKIERAFTPWNDPNFLWREAVQTAIAVGGEMADRADRAESMARIGTPGTGTEFLVNSGGSGGPGGPGGSGSPSSLPEGAGNFSSSGGSSNGTSYFSTDYGPTGGLSLAALAEQARYYRSESIANRHYKDRMKAGQEVDREAFDAIELTCKLRTKLHLPDVYAIIVAEYRTRDEPKDTRHTWIHIADVGNVIPQGDSVRILGGGLPPGFLLLNARVHLFHRGVEIATNVSERHVPLSTQKAHQFLIATHLAKHKAANRPADFALTPIPLQASTLIPPNDRKRTVTVDISPDGIPLTISPKFGDDIPAPLRELVSRFRFLPALENGKPIASTLEFKLDDLIETEDADVGVSWCERRESNPHQRLRRPLHYPLCYARK